MSDAKPEPDGPAIREFLELVLPGGPWVLTTIWPEKSEKRPTRTRTFREAGAAADWAAGQNRDGWNAYWTVNRPRGEPDKKCKKEDIEEALFTHVDVDPRPGANVEAERGRILSTLEAHRLPPTIIVDSGGGYQGLWRLDEPLFIGGASERWTDLEAYNRQLETDLGGDNCHNIDRILRVVGTVNWPGSDKTKKGRIARRARLAGGSGKAYPLSEFTAASTKAASASAGAGAAVELPSDLPSVELDALPAAVTAETRALIAHGSDRHASRSEVVWRVTHELIRAGCDDKTVAAVLMDPRYSPWAHVKVQSGGARYYVARQIERARGDAPAGGRRVLDPDDPYATASRLRDELYPHTLHTNSDFLSWRAGAYRKVEDATVEGDAWRELSAAAVRKKQGDAFVYVPFKPKPGNVEAHLRALRGLVHVPIDRITPPAWLDGDGPPPLEVIALRNGLLHVPTGELLPPDPRFFTRNALEIDFDADAPQPGEWLRFVQQVFPDPAAAGLLQEWFGYLLLPDLSQQKIMLLVGPPRSGKGVIQHVITALVGAASVCAPRSSSLASDNVGALQPLIGTTVAFLSDARFAGLKAGITETLLAISGGDNITIDRKNKLAWTGRLATRFVIMSNELPGLRDNSPALANRFTPLILEQSFLGREDTGLPSRIIDNELPGVLLWALGGWRRLHERGQFALPVASEEAIAEILDLGSPVASFVNARCELGEGKSVETDALYRAYKAWCIATEQHAAAPNVFGRDLGTATSGKVKRTKTRVGGRDGGRVPVYLGVELRDEPGPDGWHPGPERGPAGLPFGDDARWVREPY